MATLDQINRTVTCEIQSDMRKKITRRYDISDGKATMGDGTKFDANVELPWGTEDDQYEGCRLTHQDVTGQTANPNKAPNDPPAYLIRVFEEIDEENETQVGNADITFDQYNNKIVTLHWIQFSTGALANQVVGTTAAPSPNETAILKEQIETDDGTLRTITRVYTTGGIMSDVSELRFGGKVITRVIVSLNEIPATPDGYSLVGPGVVFVRGLPLYTYQYAAAAGGGTPGTSGQISIEYSNAQGGTVDFNPALPATANGITRATIRYVSTLATTSNPIPTPSGFVLVGIEQTEDTGYKMWVGRYERGQGLVIDESVIQESAALVTYHRVSYDTPPSTPSATIGGTVTLFDTGSSQGDGWVRYDYKWAEGDGEADRRYTLSQGGAVDFNPAAPASAIGNVVCTITHFTSTAVTSNPTSAPTAAFKLISLADKVSGGYRIWTAVYGFGDGLIVDETTVQQVGALVTYHRVEFGAAPATPTATIGGTVTLFDSSVTHRDGYDVYDYRWAEGDGQSSITTDGDPDGALNYTVVTFTAAATTPAYPGSGTAYLVRLAQQPQNGYFQNTAVYKKPPATLTLNKKINFTKPGNATIGGSPIQLTFDSPVTMDILAEVEVSYATTQISDTPFTVEAYATYYETYTPTDTGIAISSTKALGGYLAGASGTSGTNSVFNGILCDTWEYQLGSSTPSSFGSGAKVLDVDNDPYLVATDGTVVYRRTKVSYTF
jgi:hypothetical protein